MISLLFVRGENIWIWGSAWDRDNSWLCSRENFHNSDSKLYNLYWVFQIIYLVDLWNKVFVSIPEVDVVSYHFCHTCKRAYGIWQLQTYTDFLWIHLWWRTFNKILFFSSRCSNKTKTWNQASRNHHEPFTGRSQNRLLFQALIYCIKKKDFYKNQMHQHICFIRAREYGRKNKYLNLKKIWMKIKNSIFLSPDWNIQTNKK